MDAAVTAKGADARRTTGKGSAAKKSTDNEADRTTAAAKKTTTKKPAAKKPASKQASAKKASSTKPSAKKATTRSATTQKAASKKTASKKTASKKTTSKKTTSKKTASKKTASKKTASKRSATSKPTGNRAAKKAAKKPEKQATDRRPASSRRVTVSLAVLPGEDPWTTAEVDEVRGELEAERQRLLSEISSAEDDMATLLRDAGVGAGSDQADIGSSALERDSEMSLANNTRDMLFQVDRAKTRLDDGSYGICESCGNPIGKARLMAFPRATLCLSCKQRQERR
ncbi:MAG: DNA-binding protein [Nocardioidaceae bacterium]|nr:DNA-binding protein [Nocardioidaceae bacterium]